MRQLDFTARAQLAYNDPFTLQEMNRALKQCKKSATEEDGISYEMLKRMHSSASIFLLKFLIRYGSKMYTLTRGAMQ